MNPLPLYSVRMHAERSGEHLCGAERLAAADELEEAAASLVRRALVHPRGSAECLRLTLELLCPGEVCPGRLPDVTTVRVTDHREGRAAARHFLIEEGIAPGAVDAAFCHLVGGAAPGAKTMRGAMLIDAESGERLEPDQARGVRASRMDLSPAARTALRDELDRRGLDNPHVREALVLAAKVAQAPGVVAELGWSDDPDYTAGYLCTPKYGYVRFPHLKPAGEPKGGRAFFVRPGREGLAGVIDFLEKTPVLFDAIGAFRPDVEWRREAPLRSEDHPRSDSHRHASGKGP